jgi:hypothetical protein
VATFFAILYVDDAYLALRDLEFPQQLLDILVCLFACVGLETNVQKTQTMTCTLGRLEDPNPAADCIIPTDVRGIGNSKVMGQSEGEVQSVQ